MFRSLVVDAIFLLHLVNAHRLPNFNEEMRVLPCQDAARAIGVEITVYSPHKLTVQQLSQAASLLTAGSSQSGLLVNQSTLMHRLSQAVSLLLAEKDGQVVGVIALKNQIGGKVCPMSEAGYFVLDTSIRGTGISQCMGKMGNQVAVEKKFIAIYGDTLISNYPSLKLQFNEPPAPTIAGFMSLADGRIYVMTLSPKGGHTLEGELLQSCKDVLRDHFSHTHISDTLQRETLHEAIQNLPISSVVTPQKKISIEKKIVDWFDGKLVD